MSGYRRPDALPDALALLSAAPHRVLAGGTDLYPADAASRSWGDAGLAHPTAPPLLDLSALDDLRGITVTSQSVRFGALANWTDVLAADLPPAFEALQQAAREVGGRQIQNRGTLGGNLCNASPAADGVPPLLALDARVELASVRGRRCLPLAAFLLANRRTALARDELLVAIEVPLPTAWTRSGFLKLGARRHLVISIAMVAVVVTTNDAGIVTDARLAVGACSAVAQRLTALEADLLGAPLADAPRLVSGDHAAALSPIDDVRASAAYRRDAALVLVRRALAALADAPGRRAA